MAANTATDQFFDLWKKQMEESVQTWGRFVGQQATNSQPFGVDPLKMWRPMFDQLTSDWAKAVQQGGASPDFMAQWKTFLDQWLAAWDKMLAQVMQTDSFAQAMGKQLDQWLSAQAPIRQAAATSMETALQAAGLPSRNQVTGIARQLMELDDRLEEIENRLAATDAGRPSTVSGGQPSRRTARSTKRRPHGRTTD